MAKTKTLMFISPSVSLILASIYSVFISFQEHLYIPMLLPLLYSGLFVKDSWPKILKRLIWLNSFIALIAITLIWQDQTSVALLLFLRSNLILLFVLILFYDKDEFSIAMSMHQLGFPHKLTTIVFFTAKFIFLIKHEFVHFRKTLHVRGFIPKTNLLSYQTMAGFVGILVIKALKRSQELQKALYLRGFKREIYSLTSYASLTLLDIVTIFLTLLAFIWKQGALL